METLQIGETVNWVDVVALVFLVFYFIHGLVRGFMLQLLGIVVLVASLILASVLCGPLGALIQSKWNSPQASVPIYIAFIAVLLISLTIGMLIARRLKNVLEKAKALAYDRLLGGVVGVVKGVLLIVVLINLLGYFVLPPDLEGAEGLSASVLESRTMGVSKWATAKVLVFLPEDMAWVEEKTILRKKSGEDSDPEKDDMPDPDVK